MMCTRLTLIPTHHPKTDSDCNSLGFVPPPSPFTSLLILCLEDLKEKPKTHARERSLSLSLSNSIDVISLENVLAEEKAPKLEAYFWADWRQIELEARWRQISGDVLAPSNTLKFSLEFPNSGRCIISPETSCVVLRRVALHNFACSSSCSMILFYFFVLQFVYKSQVLGDAPKSMRPLCTGEGPVLKSFSSVRRSWDFFTTGWLVPSTAEDSACWK